MSSDLQKILESKRTFRREVAARPIAEKLRMLDALCERELAIRGRNGNLTTPPALHEASPPYRAQTK